VIKELLDRFGGRFRFVYRHLPLIDVHPNAALAAEAAEAAGAQGKFWEMHDLLYEHQDELDPHDLVHYAAELGLDEAVFSEDLDSGRFAARVGQDVNSAEEAGVAGTPSFFINEVRYRGPYDIDSVSAVLTRAGSLIDNRARASAASTPDTEE
jgi:protein-disulfide isomerase